LTADISAAVAAVADAVFKKSRRVAVVVMDFFRLGIVFPVAPGVDGATAIPQRGQPSDQQKKPLPKAHIGTSWSAALLSGPSLDLAAPRSSGCCFEIYQYKVCANSRFSEKIK
jgi:hypothetical protein